MAHPIAQPDPDSRVAPKGAAAVGHLSEIDETMQVFVLYLRRWTAAPDARDGVWTDAVERFGAARAHRVVAALDLYLVTVATHATRPIQCHGKVCSCLGEDETILMEIMRNAGRRNSPLLRMLACRLVAPAGLAATVAAAGRLYDALCGCSVVPDAPVAPERGTTLH